ncbi:MAG: PH domain-containing protein [Chloroherpetonaceae bacterium]|nr:PH domain-containing protein [Chloroherpetonaceae bacterium]MDW8437381.1 PH domain-containing protein [Chloroherpetonaceae bacterium]
MRETTIIETYAPIRYFLFSNPMVFFSNVFYGIGLAYAFIKSRQLKIKITTRRIEIQFGIFSRHVEIIELKRIKSVGYHQSFIGRLFDFGTITLRVAHKSPRTVEIPMVSPKFWAEKIRSESDVESGDEWRSLYFREMTRRLGASERQ